jgi:hypothetical protein
MSHRIFLMMAGLAAVMTMGLPAGQAASSASAKASQKTPWGDPDLQGTWTSDDTLFVPFERPKKFGTRATLTEDELKERAKSVEGNEEFVATGGEGHSPAKAQIDAAAKGEAPPPLAESRAGRGVDSQPVPLHWGEFARRPSHQASEVVDPPDGRVPPLTPEAQARLDARNKLMRAPVPASYENWSYYDRCITRGVPGSILPAVYGNGLEIVQTPGYVAIRYEMVHDVRIIPTDGRAHLGSKIRSYMGDAVGHWEGPTLVVETTNLLGGRLGVGGGGPGGAPYSEEMKIYRALHASEPQHDQLRTDCGRPENVHSHLEGGIPDHARAGVSTLRIRMPRGKYGDAQYAQWGAST